MCGIVGAWHRDGAPVDEATLVRMRDRLVSRGPDDAGVWTEGPVGFGHRRLSIIDLSPAGHQPMVDEETGNVLTYNGEVYNFAEIRRDLEAEGVAFRGHSDTEVILKAYRRWGTACVERFVGMFAFGLWDASKRALWLVRDRIGIKPLYYFVARDRVIFGSRIKALLAHPDCPRSVDREALALYFDAGFVPAPWSILAGVRKLEPGHTLWIESDSVRDECYWDLDGLAIDAALERADDEEMVDRLDAALRTAVEARLVADVPLGAFLSGGIDSSTVVALMSEIGGQPSTFSIGFDEAKYSEAHHARAVADHLATNHHERIMRSRDVLDLIDELTEMYDEPFADYSSLPTTLVSRFAREHVTVTLSGDGGDELFAGYNQYEIFAGVRPAFRLPSPARGLLAAGIGLVPGHRAALLASCLRLPRSGDVFAFVRSTIKDYDRGSFFEDGGLPTLAGLFDARRDRFPALDAMSEACRLDLAYYLTDGILQKVDVASMSISLEARVPILDHRVIEFSQSLPIRFKRRGGKGKWLLRQVLARYVPPELFERPKVGFGVPINEWFRGDLSEMLRDELSERRIRALGYLDPAGVTRLVDLHLSGRRDVHPVLWSLLALVRWHDRVERVW